MVLPVSLQAVAEEMDLPSVEMTAYINRKTGELVSLSEDDAYYAGRSEDDGHANSVLQEWQMEAAEQAKAVLENDHYVELPDAFDIHEYAIMERFCHSLDDERVRDALLRAIGGKGAFRYFKDRISEEGVREDWFNFRNQALKDIAADFLQSQGIAFVDH